jgi:hypothetical protein
MNLSFGKLDGVCLDCVYQHAHVINGCQHTICMNCLYQAIDEKIESGRTMFICPRCENVKKHRTRMKSMVRQQSNTGQGEKKLIKQLPKLEQDLNEQRPETVLARTDTHEHDSSWPMGTESWLIHEIKPQRERDGVTINQTTEEFEISGDHEKTLEGSTHFTQAENEAQTNVMNVHQEKATEERKIGVVSSEKGVFHGCNEHLHCLSKTLPESDEANYDSWIQTLPVYSNCSIRKRSPSHSFICLSRVISHAIVVMVICFTLILIHSGILHDLTYIGNNLQGYCDTSRWKPNGCKMLSIYNEKYFAKLQIDEKINKRRRNSETLWIYAIT